MKFIKRQKFVFHLLISILLISGIPIVTIADYGMVDIGKNDVYIDPSLSLTRKHLPLLNASSRFPPE